MFLETELVRQFSHKQNDMRVLCNNLTESWLLGGNPTKGGLEISKSLTSALVRNYIKKAKHKVFIKKSKKLNIFFKKNKQLLYTRTAKGGGASFSILFLYNLFFWATLANGATLAFRRRDKSISNKFNSIYSSKVQNHQSINKKFSKTYSSISNNNLYKLSQPLLLSLSGQGKTKQNKNPLKVSRSLGYQRLVAAISGSYLHTINTERRQKSYKNVCSRKIAVLKTSKVVYSLNHYALNTFLSF